MRVTKVLLALGIASTLTVVASAQQVSDPEVRAFLQSIPIHGNSYERILAVSELSDVSELAALLERETEEAYWTQATALLSVADDEEVVDVLIRFVERVGTADQPLSRARHDARSSAIRSLGFLVNRIGSERALTYLIDSLTPSVWRERDVQGYAPWDNSYPETDLQLSVYALFGLAFSGHPRAGDALRTLLTSPTPEQLQFRDAHETTIAFWLDEVYEPVVEFGLASMFSRTEAEDSE